MALCEKPGCTNPATHKVTLTGSSGRVLMADDVCDEHAAQERVLRDSGLSMAVVTIERLAEQ